MVVHGDAAVSFDVTVPVLHCCRAPGEMRLQEE
jgi:hypothetical protein